MTAFLAVEIRVSILSFMSHSIENHLHESFFCISLGNIVQNKKIILLPRSRFFPQFLTFSQRNITYHCHETSLATTTVLLCFSLYIRHSINSLHKLQPVHFFLLHLMDYPTPSNYYYFLIVFCFNVKQFPLFGYINLHCFCSQGESILADSATEQLEFIALSQRTGDPKYQQKVYPLDCFRFIQALLYAEHGKCSSVHMEGSLI